MARAHQSRVGDQHAHESHKSSAPTAQARREAQGLEALAERSAVVQRLRRVDEVANDSPTTAQARHYDELANSDRTQLPMGLQSGLEQLSGLDLSPVRVHYDSPEPGKLDALAITRGRDIHLGPGQEAHLPHESWHAVQQMRGIVEPTSSVGGVAINDSPVLEREADVMGSRAQQLGQQTTLEGRSRVPQRQGDSATTSSVVQPRWKSTRSLGVFEWSAGIDGLTWYASSAGLLWYKISKKKNVPAEALEHVRAHEGERLPLDQWMALGIQPPAQETAFKGDHVIPFNIIWDSMVSKMLKPKKFGYVIRFYNNPNEANSHAFQKGDQWVDPGMRKTELAAWHMFAGQMPDAETKQSPFVSFATNLDSLVNAAETPFGSAAVKGIVKGGKKEFRGKPGLEALARRPAAKIGLFAIPAKLLIHGRAINPFIDGIRRTNPQKYADLAAHFKDENEATVYSPDEDITRYLIAEYDNPYISEWQ